MYPCRYRDKFNLRINVVVVFSNSQWKAFKNEDLNALLVELLKTFASFQISLSFNGSVREK